MISVGMFLRPGFLVEQTQDKQSAISVSEQRGVAISLAESAAVFPIAEYATRRTKKIFGQYVDDGRFLGYHTGEDIEYEDEAAEVPVVSIADGVVRFSGWVAGYGGVIVIAHTVGQDSVNALYGHLDIDSAKVKIGETVRPGQFLANLGEHNSDETDGRRKHLHFGLYRGLALQFLGYVKDPQELSNWIGPNYFFDFYGVLPRQ